MAQYKYEDVHIRALIEALKSKYSSNVTITCDSLDDTSCTINIPDSLEISKEKVDEIVHNVDTDAFQKKKREKEILAELNELDKKVSRIEEDMIEFIGMTPHKSKLNIMTRKQNLRKALSDLL